MIRDANGFCYTFRYLNQRVKEYWHFVIGKHFKDEQNLRPVNLYENFKIVFLNVEGSLSVIFEMRMIRKKRPTLKHSSALYPRETL